MERAMMRTKRNDVSYEAHHIIPKSLGGTNTKENIALLTYREHFIAHALLTSMCKSPRHKRSMSYAFVTMNRDRTGQRFNHINSHLYELIKEKTREDFIGKNNPFYGKGHFGKDNHFYGKTHTEKSKQKMRESHVGKHSGENNHFYGKIHTEETKQLLSDRRSVPLLVIFLDGKEIQFKKRKDLGVFLNKSEHLGAKLLKPKYKHLWLKYNIKDIQCV